MDGMNQLLLAEGFKGEMLLLFCALKAPEVFGISSPLRGCLEFFSVAPCHSCCCASRHGLRLGEGRSVHHGRSHC